ncbi:MAG: beta-lactamase class [Patescibacteria group bacterium]|nr:beta-lactamase class [Patescibacteria group bacterium]
MRKLFTILIYTLVVLLIGRNIPSLPRFTVMNSPERYHEDLKKEIEKIVKDKKGNYGIYFTDLTEEKSFGINEQELFTAASVNKVPIVAVLYYLEHKGKINFDEQITLQEVDIQDYGTGSLRYQKPGSTYSLKTLAKLALKQSDNTAAHILSNRIGTEVIQNTIEELGMTQTEMEENLTSPEDMSLLFSLIYNEKITSKPKTKELLGFMNETDIEDRLPSQLPQDAVIYHKTGDAVGSLHDIGIIEYHDKSYSIAIFTSDIGTDEDTVKKTIGEIGKTILKFYENRE